MSAVHSSAATGLSLSVCVATHNRGVLLRKLLDDLREQDLPPDRFEVVVVDDGSSPPASDFLGGFTGLQRLRILAQENAGPAAARHRAIDQAGGDVIVIVDDDMRFPADFLRRHLEAHERGADVVQGLIQNAPGVDTMPLFERFHADQLVDTVEGYASGRYEFRGSHLCTGNVSFRRGLYLSVGGFDTSLPRSEDRELGIRFEKAGATLVFSPEARTTHLSDHQSLGVWLDRGFRYGLSDSRISRKHPDFTVANPWAFIFEVSPLSRPILGMVVALPRLARVLSRATMLLATGLDRVGLKRLPVVATTLAYGIEYFRGVREDAGSLGNAVRQLVRYRRERTLA